MSHIITVKDMCLWYGDHQALKNVNIEISEKSITAFIGPSGCGMSTFLKTPCDDGVTRWVFSSCGGFLDLRRGIQDASCVGPGKSDIPFELRRKAGDCSRVTAGPIDLI